MVVQGILESVQPRGATNASPVVWQRKKCGELIHCVDLKTHINGKVTDEEFQYQTWRRSSTTYMGPHIWAKKDLSESYYQIELDEGEKDIHNQHISEGVFKMFRLPHGLKNSSSNFQICIESKLKGIKGVVILQDGVLVYETIKEQLDKRMLAVKSRLREKNFTIGKKSDSKAVHNISFLGYSISKEGVAPHPKRADKKMQKHQQTTNNSNSFLG